jgi:hypothetical protein
MMTGYVLLFCADYTDNQTEHETIVYAAYAYDIVACKRAKIRHRT